MEGAKRVHLSPDEIQRRTFAIEDRGYDRDEVRDFLLEVASALRLALHTTRPPATASPAGLPVAEEQAADAGDDFTRLGREVANVLRMAHDAVALLRDQASLEIEGQRQDATARAEELRQQADADAAWTHDRAKRVLITAQEQADAIVADAERAATELIETARRQADDHTEQVAASTRRHAEQILRAEREALRRLHQAQAGVAAAVEMLTGSESRPVVDLTALRPNVRLGSLSLDIDGPDPNEDDGGPDTSGTGRRDHSADDPALRMVRRAVNRAVEHAQRSEAALQAEVRSDPTAGPDHEPAEPARRAAIATADHARAAAPATPGPAASDRDPSPQASR